MPIKISEAATNLYKVACNLYLGIIVASIPKTTKGALPLTPKKKDGTPLTSRTDTLPETQSDPYFLLPQGKLDSVEAANDPAGPAMEIKEWQGIITFLKSLPTKNSDGETVLSMDERMQENRTINKGS